MAIIHGSRTKKKMHVINANLTALFIFLAYAIFIIWEYLRSGNFLFLMAVWIPILGYSAVFIRKSFAFETRILKGIGLENTVLKNLLKLPKSYSILQHISLPHDIKDIDFVVIGPTGIFAIETKTKNAHLPSAEKELIRQSLTLQDIISVKTKNLHFVEPILVFPSLQNKQAHNHPPQQVKILSKNKIANYILSQNDRLSSYEMAKIEEELFRLIHKPENL